MKDKQKIFQLLGLATRARMIVTGEELAIREVQNGKAHLVIVSNDASANTVKKITDKCNFFNVEKHVFGSREELGHAIGKESRVTRVKTYDGFAREHAERTEDNNRGCAHENKNGR